MSVAPQSASQKVRIEKLELHASYACNLTCESCSHFSNHGFSGLISPEEAEQQMSLWAPRVDAMIFSLTGGESTLNPRLTEIVAAAVRLFPRVEVATNGFFLHRHPDLGRVLGGAAQWGRLSISEHGADYPEVINAAIARGERWTQDFGVQLVVRRYDSTRPWTRRYTGYGPTLRPYQDRDPQASHAICPANQCVQLHQGLLWKCPLAAYLPMVTDRFPALREPWALGLSYQALSPAATDDELAAFINRGAEAICGLCPAEPQPFIPPSPLIPARTLLRAAGGLA